ncbi:MAG: GNAT family N-acetyltransferase [Actinobacteria bacterium]|nr:GNAT family N-acetyltransferase [Actinomycetota bacterium]
MDRRMLTDKRGDVVSYVANTRGERQQADIAEVVRGRGNDEAARALTGRCPGWYVSTLEPLLAAAVGARGATPTRHVHVMVAQTRPNPEHDEPAASADLHVAFIDFAAFEWAEILPSWKAAYAPGHPDHEPGDDDLLLESELRPYVERAALGPVHRSTTLAIVDGRVAGAIVISLRPEPVPFGGPWITEVWRDPATPLRGLGAALIERALGLLCADGFKTLGLAVTDGNPARRVYERLGFEPALESWTYLLPE